MRRALLAVLFLAMMLGGAAAHEVRPAYLELRQTGPETYDVLWKVPARGEGQRLGLYVEMPPGSVEVADRRTAVVNNAAMERWAVRRPGGFNGTMISIAGLAATMTDVLVRIEHMDGTIQVDRLAPSSPSFLVTEAPGTLEVATTYLKLGVEHILLGFDHLAFVLALLIITSGLGRLVKTVTAFTVAHSITLSLAALGFVHVPQAAVETVIALSILFLAVEIIRSREGRPSLTQKLPWLIAFAFGLLHGFGFAGALSEIGLPQREIPMALLAFNTGVELGQLAFVAAIVMLMTIAGILVARWPQWSWRIAPYAIGSISAFWFIQRVGQL